MIKLFSVIYCFVSLLPSAICGQHFVAKHTGDGIEILEDGKPVLTYQDQPKSLNGKYERAGYIHPLYSLGGNALTENFPEDHPYHRGIFWAWHQIILNNKKIADGWISEDISWTPAAVKILDSKNKTMLSAEIFWESAGPGRARKTPVIREETDIAVFRSNALYRIIDFDIRLFALIDGLKIGGSDDPKGYGGFCLRLKLPGDISFISKDSLLKPQETAVSGGAWTDFNGSFDGNGLPKSGVAVFINPFNPGVQRQWILRKEKSMQNTVYPGRTPVALPKRGLRLRYRLIIHRNKIGKEDLEKLYQEYIGKQ